MKSQMIPFEGGIMTEGPLLARNPGTCIIAMNYEIPPTGGYRRIQGYELYDGSATPATVPGTGPIRGTFIYKDEVYCIRDSATNGVLYKESAAGWVVVDDTSLSPGGQYEFIVYNFFATDTTLRVYGVNGVDKAFEFNGTTITFLTTGMTADTPTHIAQFKKFLFLSFPGGSVQHSAAGTPATWSPILGASEIGVGDEVTGFSTEVGGTLVIFSREKIHVLSGSGAILTGGGLDWTMNEFSSDSGALPYSIQRMGRTMFLDDRGLSLLMPSDVFGDFASNTFSVGFRPLVQSLAKLGVVGSTIVKESNQYRIFFGSGTVLCCSFSGDRFMGATTFQYPDIMTAVVTGEINSIERVFAGDDAGNVYELNKGTSFNGAAIRSYLRLQYYHYKKPTQRKRFRRVHVEAEADNSVTITFEPTFNYAASDVPKGIAEELLLISSGGYWNQDAWNTFNWALPLAGSIPIRIAGVGYNMSPLFFHESTTEEPFTIYGLIVDYDDRGMVR